MKDRDVWARSARALAKQDPVMASLLRRHGPPLPRWLSGSSFVALARSITYQQLAGAAARTIWSRVEDAVGRPFTPERVLALPESVLAAAGLSTAKRRAILDLSSKCASGALKLLSLPRLDDEEVIERLVNVRGIGRWTAEMFLLFKLRRQDVWPVTDLGVRKGFMRAYGHATLPEPKALLLEGERFRPYRSVAAWYLWRAAEDQGLAGPTTTKTSTTANAGKRKRSDVT